MLKALSNLCERCLLRRLRRINECESAEKKKDLRIIHYPTIILFNFNLMDVLLHFPFYRLHHHTAKLKNIKIFLYLLTGNIKIPNKTEKKWTSIPLASVIPCVILF